MISEHYKQWNDLIQTGDYDQASIFLSSIATEYQRDLDYWYCLVHVNRKLNQLDRAEEICKKAMTEFPDSSKLNYERGLIHQAKQEYLKAIKYLKAAVDTKERLSLSDAVDYLNSLALTWRQYGDFDGAMMFYNQALEKLAQAIYIEIIAHPLRITDLRGDGQELASQHEEGWMRLAVQIATKNAAKDGIQKIRIPSGNTANDMTESNPDMGYAFYDDKDSVRYLLPTYFISFNQALKSNVYYANIVNNIGVVFAEKGDHSEAAKCYRESIKFIPAGVDYPNPYVNLKASSEAA